MHSGKCFLLTSLEICVSSLISPEEYFFCALNVIHSFSLCVADKKSAPSSELHRPGGPPCFTEFQLTQKRSGRPKECLKVREYGTGSLRRR